VLERRSREFGLLERRYGSVQYGNALDWLMIRQFPLPPGWNRPVTELLILIPPGYPLCPPDNFFVREGLRTVSGALPNGYFEGQAVLGPGWGQFSFHVQEWRPGTGETAGDNILTFLLGVEQRLREGA
jgi:hypothetical protein